jgi:O-methyltransferase
MRHHRQGVMMDFAPDFNQNDIDFYARVAPYTLTSPERIQALRKAVYHVNRENVPGAIVECGVWKGGSAMAAMLASLENPWCPYGTPFLREFYLYDTFEGMPPPTIEDVDLYDEPASFDLLRPGHTYDCPLHEVVANIESVYNGPVEYVKGRVEDTIPRIVPEAIALLRLDTDWYASTKHELTHLYPLLAVGGILVIDDYGHWQGARKAVVEFWGRVRPHMHLVRVDYTGRVGVKIA